MSLESGSPVVSRKDMVRAVRGEERVHERCVLGSLTGRIAGATPASRSSRPRISTVVAAALLALSACDPYVEGNGVYREEDRTGSVGTPFTGIHVEDGMIATVTSSAADFKVVASGDSNVLQYVRTQVEDDATLGIRVLHVWVDLAGYSSTNPSAVVVQVPAIVYALSKEYASVEISEAKAPIFTVRAESRGYVQVAGPHVLDPAGDPAGDTIHVSVSNGTVDASGYVTTSLTEAAVVDLSANASARLHADGPVVGTAAGGSRLWNTGTGTCMSVTLLSGATADCPTP